MFLNQNLCNLMEYTERLLSFRTGTIKSICLKEMTLLLFSFRHTSLLTVHPDLHDHTASGCLCRIRPLQWYLMYLSRLSGCPKSSQKDAPSSGISRLGTKSNQQVLIWRIRRVVEHIHFSLGQKLLDDCRVVGLGVVVQKETVTRFTHALSNTSNSV